VNERISPADAARAALDAAEGGPPVVIVAAVAADGAVYRAIVDEAGRARGSLGHATLDEAALRLARRALTQPSAEPVIEPIELEGRAWLLYVEAHHAPERLVVVGAGHIAVPLAELGVMLGFLVTVLDDREEFATAERFADDVVVRRADFEGDPFAGVTIDERTCVALVTRGHRWDFDCLNRLMEAPAWPRYIGMIGSRRRVRAAFHALLEAGVPRAELAAIHAPIGLEIGAETPAEIAVAIAAELVAVRRGATAGAATTTALEQVLERLLREPPAES
jgi:xanthine dehydrogenase accessory factor